MWHAGRATRTFWSVYSEQMQMSTFSQMWGKLILPYFWGLLTLELIFYLIAPINERRNLMCEWWPAVADIKFWLYNKRAFRKMLRRSVSFSDAYSSFVPSQVQNVCVHGNFHCIYHKIFTCSVCSKKKQCLWLPSELHCVCTYRSNFSVSQQELSAAE